MPSTHRSSKPLHFSHFGKAGLEFDMKAMEVTILDRAGRPIWRKTRGEVPAPIRWNGINSTGQAVETGDYICKINYGDDKITYLPFVFMKRN